MRYLLNVVYLLLLLVVSPWLLCAAVFHGKYRAGWAAKLLGHVPRRQSSDPCIWLHAVSAGEVNLLAPLIDRLNQRRPDCELIISTTTKTGFDLALQKYAPRTVFYCPLDFSWAISNALRRARPDLLILGELELWPNLIRLAARREIPLALVNGRLSDRSARGYRWIRPIVATCLKSIDVIAVQDQTYAERFVELGASRLSVHITGSVKFDGACTDRDQPRTVALRRLAQIGPEDVVFIAGSTQEPEEAMALAAWQQLQPEFPQLRLILVPRHPQRFEAVATLLRRSNCSWQRRSQLSDSKSAAAWRVLLVDAMGELGAWWGTSKIAFVGGSLSSRGGQNMIEPAAYGAAVSFGPNTRNFREIVRLLRNRSAATVVQDQDELTAFVRRCLMEPAWADQQGKAARKVVMENLGAADRTCDLIEPLLAPPPVDHRRSRSSVPGADCLKQVRRAS